jgi:hypothetical protein
VFSSPGTYRVTAEQEMIRTRADVITYDDNEYWVIAEGPFAGMTIYKNQTTGKEYRTNISTVTEFVPVSEIVQVVTPEMCNTALIMGPGGNLVGIKNGFTTERVK